MTDNNKPSIAELQAGARRRMSTTTLDDFERTGQDLIAAAPVLLEIAAAAMALHEQEQIAAKARYLVYSSLNKNAVPSDDNYAAAGEQDAKLAACRDRYRTALGKVRP